MSFSRQGRAGACLLSLLVVGCTDSGEMMTIVFTETAYADPTEDGGATFLSGTTNMTDPQPTTNGPTSDPSSDPSTTSSETTDPSTSEPPPTTEPDETTSTDPSGTTEPDETTTGGLPDGFLADDQRYPSDLVLLNGELYWANNNTADCVRKVAIAGGPVVDIGCEGPGFFPLQVTPYNGKIAWTFMSDGGGPQTLGFGGVRVSDGPGMAPVTINGEARFKSSSSGAICNDTIAAEGDKLFWYSHILGGFNEGTIQRWNGSEVDVFDPGSDFPYGVVTTPTTLWFSATENYDKLALDAAENSPPTIVGMTQGSSCGRVAAGETIYVTSRGTFATAPALFVVTGGGVALQRELDELAYDLAVDDTHLYFAFEDRIDRVPLADLQNGAFENLVNASEYIGGVLVDDTNLYWTEYAFAGSVRMQPK